MLKIYSDGVQDCLETRVDVVRTSLRQLQDKLSQVSDISGCNHDFNCYFTGFLWIFVLLKKSLKIILKAEASLRRLRQSKFDLEQEINVKEGTLRIDADHCMNALRRNMVLPQP